MSSPDAIVCKPTPWFLLRAVVMVVMFGVFAVMFYIDGSTGYRKKNETFYLHQAFQTANAEFSKMNNGGSLTADEWKAFAQKQSVAFPEDHSVLPQSLKLPMAWPQILHDFERMKPLQWNILWREYTKENGLNAKPSEQPYDSQKIKEQWVVFVLCSGIALIAAFFLLRTMRRSIAVDANGLITQQGKHIPYADLKKLDLRKWDTKGLAFVDYEGTAGKGRVRIDGLTYGGFKKEHDEPAERLMQKLRSRFSGEILEYAAASTSPADTEGTKTT